MARKLMHAGLSNDDRRVRGNIERKLIANMRAGDWRASAECAALYFVLFGRRPGESQANARISSAIRMLMRAL